MFHPLEIEDRGGEVQLQVHWVGLKSINIAG